MYGFNFGDVIGVRDTSVDTEELVRAAMIAFMEGAIAAGMLHGDLHAAKLTKPWR